MSDYLQYNIMHIKHAESSMKSAVCMTHSMRPNFFSSSANLMRNTYHCKLMHHKAPCHSILHFHCGGTFNFSDCREVA